MMPRLFNIEYVWMNEADVDVEGGMMALFFVVLMMSLSALVGSCASLSSSSSSSSNDDFVLRGRYGGGNVPSLSLVDGDGSAEGYAK